MFKNNDTSDTSMHKRQYAALKVQSPQKIRWCF